MLACLPCNRFIIEGSGQWVNHGEQLMDSLRLLAGVAKEQRDAVEQAMTSDIRDPRWTDIGMEWL